jgi:predicted Fe-Mo cluster-binding NifX family protein
MKLNAAGAKVFRAEAPTVKDNLDMLNEGRLLQLSMQQTCGGHGGGCAR